jgi:hypothetical protein
MRVTSVKKLLGLMALFGTGCLPMVAAERVTLANGFTVDCLRHEAEGDRTRLVLAEPTGAGEAAYMDVAGTAIASIALTAEPVTSSGPKDGAKGHGAKLAGPASAVALAGLAAANGEGRTMTADEMHPLLTKAGVAHRIDEDLLASVVRAESGGQTHAVSRTGARGLMQLMPGTANSMGVADAFEPGQNVDGGAAYLDRLLIRYHDDIALALAAYNAGPGAVDKWHGVPPYRETRAYVARVIREFNRRKLAGMMASTRGPQ